MFGAAISHRAGFSLKQGRSLLEKLEKQALQVAKEVTIKFIEVGRISPNNFGEHFSEIYGQILKTVASGGESAARAGTAEAGDD